MPLVTILIITYERHPYLRRLFPYLARSFDRNIVKFLVLDGSVIAAPENKALCESFNFSYQHYDSSVGFNTRVLSGIQGVKTPYVSMHPDDDFLNFQGFLNALTFLQEHNDYVSAHGKYVGFSVSKEDKQVSWQQVYQLPYYKKEVLSIDQAEPFRRLMAHYETYIPLFYAIHRTDIFQEVFAEVVRSVDKEDYYLSELLIGALMPLYGKIRQSHDFYMARELGQSVPRSNTTPEKLILNDHFYERYARYKEAILRHLPHIKLGASLDEHYMIYADSVIDMCFFAYVFMCLSPAHSKNRMTPVPHGQMMMSLVGLFQNIKLALGKYSTRTRNYWIRNHPKYAKVVNYVEQYYAEYSVSPLSNRQNLEPQCAGDGPMENVLAQ